MENADGLFTDMLSNIKENTTLLNDEETYIGENGHRYCKKCNTPRECLVSYINVWMPCLCECLIKEKEEQEQREKKEKEILRLRKLKKLSLIGEKYKDVSFDNTETKHSERFEYVFNQCKRYCNVTDKVLSKGLGIFIYGNSGTGKSRLTACMCNALTDKGYSAIYTNISEISKQLRAIYNDNNESEYAFIEKLTAVDFLFIDDFGTELVTKNGKDTWLQEKVFEIINKRYNDNKCVIVTSNYSIRELISNRGLADKTADRLVEMCTIFELNGQSFRQIHSKTF